MTPEIAIIKEYPKRAGMILRRYAERLEFLCVICDKTKKSPLQAETTEGPACNGCYGQKVAEWDRYQEQPGPTIMSPEHSAQESTRCYECSLSEDRCVKHRQE